MHLEWSISWSLFAVAAVIFVLDAIVTMVALPMVPGAVEQNPVARWFLDAHPYAPFVLKGAIVIECAVIAVAFRAMGERWAAYVVTGLMAAVGLMGIWSAVVVVAA
jgi:hypothetical protein